MLSNKLLIVAGVGVCMLLQGCTSFMESWNRVSEENERKQQEFVRQEAQKIVNRVENQCRMYGFKPGTDSFAACKERGINAEVAKIQRAQDAEQQRDQAYWRAYRERNTVQSPSGSNTNCSPTGNGNFSCNTTRY